jgi:uncharacterized protein
MRTYMARLGAFTFSLDTAAFQELQRVSTYRWEAKNRIGRKPAQQNVGSGADTIRLNGTIYPHYRGGLGQMGVLRSLADAGEPLPLIYAFESAGQYCGRWCVTEISETRTVFFDNGAPRRIDFTLSLVEYGDDEGVFVVIPAFDDVTPATVPEAEVDEAVTSAETLESKAEEVADQEGALSVVGEVAEKGQNVVATISNSINDVLNSDAVRLAVTTVQEIRSLGDAAKGLKSAVRGLEGIASNPSNALSALGSLSASAGAVSDVLSSASEKLGIRSELFNGSSEGSLHMQQISSAVGTATKLAAAAGSLKSTADTLKGFF